jgi:hypothetical protein
LDVWTSRHSDVRTSGRFDVSLTCNSPPILQAAEEEQQVAPPEVAPDKEEEGQEKVAAEDNAPGDKEGHVLGEWVKCLELAVNGKTRIKRRCPTKDRLLEHLQSCDVAASITDKKSILENLVFKTVPLDRNDPFHSGIHGFLG